MSSYPKKIGSNKEHEDEEYSEIKEMADPGAIDLTKDIYLFDPHNAKIEIEKMPKFLGVRICREGQVYFVDYSGSEITKGAKVLVELEQGVALAVVVALYYQESTFGDEDFVLDGTFRGFATAEDIAIHTENNLLAAEAAAFCKTCIRQRKLDMKLVNVVVLHDKSKIIFFFTAPTRIDFRELVKDLVRSYRTRIELRHIGVRHEAQMLGGLGNCGRVCCCHGFLRKFAPVTIRMAKEQNLFLNPAKLSGLCGRLLCCLSYEQANYEEFNKKCPRQGRSYETDLGTMRVLQNNIFTRKIVCMSSDGEENEFQIDEWEDINPRRFDSSGNPQEHVENRRRRNSSRNQEDESFDDEQNNNRHHKPRRQDASNDEGGQNRRRRSPK